MIYKQPKPIPNQRLDGRKVLPEVGIDSDAFKYVQAIHTDLKATFARAREKIGPTKTQKHV